MHRFSCGKKNWSESEDSADRTSPNAQWRECCTKVSSLWSQENYSDRSESAQLEKEGRKEPKQAFGSLAKALNVSRSSMSRLVHTANLRSEICPSRQPLTPGLQERRLNRAKSWLNDSRPVLIITRLWAGLTKSSFMLTRSEIANWTVRFRLILNRIHEQGQFRLSLWALLQLLS